MAHICSVVAHKPTCCCRRGLLLLLGRAAIVSELVELVELIEDSLESRELLTTDILALGGGEFFTIS